MSDIVIDFPLDESISVMVGEKLTLKYTEDCRACWDPDDEGLFNHPLPHEEHKKGYEWTGTAVKNGSIDCSYVAHGEKCEKKDGATSSVRTITVGDGRYVKV